MKNIDELEQLKKSLEYRASLPDANFEYKLKEKLLKQNSKNGFFYGIHLNYSLAINFAVILIILGVGTFAAFNLNQSNNTTQHSQNLVFSKDPAKQEILNNVIKNNPLILMQDTTQATSFEAPASGEISSNTSLKSVTDNNLIYKVIMTSELGAQAQSCLDTKTQPTTIDLTNYTSDNGQDSYFKSIATDNNNKVLSYYLSDNTSQISYLGGQNALRYNSSTPQVTQLANKVKETLLIDSIISMDTKVGTDNVQYIEIQQRESNNMCDIKDNVGPILATIQIDENTFKIISKSYYLGTVSDENLIISYKFQTYTYEPNPQLVLEEFKYNLDIPLLDSVNQ